MGSLFKKTGIELELLTDINMLLMVEKGISGGICHGIHRHTRANNKYIKKYDKMKIHHILCIQMQIIYMAGQCVKSYK